MMEMTLLVSNLPIHLIKRRLLLLLLLLKSTDYSDTIT